MDLKKSGWKDGHHEHVKQCFSLDKALLYVSYPVTLWLPNGWFFWKIKISWKSQDSTLNISKLDSPDTFDRCFSNLQKTRQASSVATPTEICFICLISSPPYFPHSKKTFLIFTQSVTFGTQNDHYFRSLCIFAH